MKKAIFLFFGLALNQLAYGGTTHCKLISEEKFNTLTLLFEEVSWDVAEKTAVLVDDKGKKIPATITAIRPHGDGVKVNIEFSYSLTSDSPARTLEFAIFTRDDTYGVIGVAYKVDDGKRLLDFMLGAAEARCPE